MTPSFVVLGHLREGPGCLMKGGRLDREDLNIETPIPLLTVETTVAGAVKSCESNQEAINNVCLEL